MSFFQQFYCFDPKRGEPPYNPFSPLPDIVERAREILHSRSFDEIVAVAENIDGMISEFFRQAEEGFKRTMLENYPQPYVYSENHQDPEAAIDDLISQGLPVYGPSDYYYESEDNMSEVDALKACIDEYDIASEDFENAEQCEYFAVLALWLVGDCIGWMKSPENSKIPELLGILSAAGQYAILAMDAVCYAERLKNEFDIYFRHGKIALDHLNEVKNLQTELQHKDENIDKITEAKIVQRRSEDSRRAAYIKNKDNIIMRQDSIKYYEEHKSEFKSKADAARFISTKLEPVTYDTVYRWIINYEKMRSASRPCS